MKVFHQLGFREGWNFESFEKGYGDGFIFSPVNLPYDKLRGVKQIYKNSGVFDPQLYFPKDSKSKLSTYMYFPANLLDGFQTTDFDSINREIADLCIDTQLELGFESIVIPTRYFDVAPSDFIETMSQMIVEPFLATAQQKGVQKDLLLTLIVKPGILSDTERRNEYLNWITGLTEIAGVYLVFQNSSPDKQIKDIDYLFNALQFIHFLKQNELRVHIGYTNTEGLLYSIANPDSIAMGSYENLRSFKPSRFISTEGGVQRSPNARVYSGKLLQWIDFNYLPAFKRLVPDFESFFEETEFQPLFFHPEKNWHFQNAQPYKHYFEVFSNQVDALPATPSARIPHIKELITLALRSYDNISESGVLLDRNSDGSHLNSWYNAISMYEAFLKT